MTLCGDRFGFEGNLPLRKREKKPAHWAGFFHMRRDSKACYFFSSGFCSAGGVGAVPDAASGAGAGAAAGAGVGAGGGSSFLLQAVKPSARMAATTRAYLI